MLNPLFTPLLMGKLVNFEHHLQVKKHIVNVSLSPFAAVEPRQHPTGWILFSTVVRVSFLTGQKFVPAAVLNRFGFGGQI